MPDQLVVEIIQSGDGVAFRPDGAAPGANLLARPFDLVVWSNRTDSDITLICTDPLGLAINQNLPAGDSSQSQFRVPTGTSGIDYGSVQPAQRHRIAITQDT